MQTLIADLEKAFPERSEAIRAMMCALVAREHCYILGPPGTGKSLLVRTFADALKRSYFEMLMARFTEPSEIFGAVDVNAFRAGKYVRNTAKMMPESEIVFLDEAFKANSAILNNLLTILNERTYVSNPVPLMSCFAASNELPEGEELSALYDRLLVRIEVNYISDDNAFETMLQASTPHITSTIDIKYHQSQARCVTITPETIQAITGLRNACKKSGISCSDRRWRQCLNLIKAHAHIKGRSSTHPDDLEILENVLWNKPKDRVAVSKVIQSVISPSGAVAVELLDAARDLLKNIGTDMAQLGSAVKDISDIQKRLTVLPKGHKVNHALDEVASIKANIGKLAMRAAGIEL